MPVKKSQVEKFREAAAALGADVSDAEYDAAVEKVAKAPERIWIDRGPERAARRHASGLAGTNGTQRFPDEAIRRSRGSCRPH